MQHLGIRRLTAAMVAVFVLVAGMSLLQAGAAAAHAGVTASFPEQGDQRSDSPGYVELTFNEEISPDNAYVAVVGPDGNFWQRGDVTVDGTKASIAVMNPLGPAGEYTINYRVVSADGHPVEGQRVFTMVADGGGAPGLPDAGGAGTTEMTVAVGPDDAAVDDGSDSGNTVWYVLIGVAVVLIVAGAVVIVLARRRS